MSRESLPAGFGALWITVAVDLIGFGIVIPILPLYAENFDASPALIGLLFASFSLAQFAASPIWGRLSDRIGRKPVLIASLVGSAIGSLLTAFAPTMAVLFLGRLVDGASGGSVAVAQAAAADLSGPDERPRLLGLLGAAYGIGFVIGPALGGLAALVGSRTPFLLAAGLAAANALVASRRLTETAQPKRRTEQPVRGASTGTGSLLVVGFLSTAAFGAFEATFALLGARRLGLNGTATSAVFVTAGLLIAVANTRGVAPIVGRLGALRALRLGLILDAAGLLVLARTNSLPLLATAIALLSAGHGLAMPALTTAIAERVPQEQRGAALGSQQSAASLARIAGPVAAGGIFSAGGPTAAFAVAATLPLLATLATRRHPDLTLVPVGSSAHPVRRASVGAAPGGRRPWRVDTRHF